MTESLCAVVCSRQTTALQVLSGEHLSPHILPMAWYSSVMGVEQRSEDVAVSPEITSGARLEREPEGAGWPFAPRFFEGPSDVIALRARGKVARGKVLFLARRVLGRCCEISPWVRSKAEEREKLRMVGGKCWGQVVLYFESHPGAIFYKGHESYCVGRVTHNKNVQVCHRTGWATNGGVLVGRLSRVLSER